MNDARGMVGIRVRHRILDAEGVVRAESFHDAPDEYQLKDSETFTHTTPRKEASSQPWVFVLLVVVDLVDPDGPHKRRRDALGVGDIEQWVARDCTISERFTTLVGRQTVGPAAGDQGVHLP